MSRTPRGRKPGQGYVKSWIGIVLAGGLLHAGSVHAHPGRRWGIEVAPQWTGFTHAATGAASLNGTPNENRSRTSLGGGLVAEVPTRGRWTYGVALRYQEPAAAVRHATGFQFFNGGQGYEQWADDRVRMRELTLAPGAGIGIGEGLRVAVSLEATYLLQARFTRDLSLVALNAQPVLFRPLAGAITPLEGHFDTDETARYHRWLAGTTAGLSWEHAVFGQPIRLAADYQIMLNEPSRDASFRQRMQALRLGVAWLH